MSFSSSRRFGLNRPSLESMRTTRPPTVPAAPTTRPNRTTSTSTSTTAPPPGVESDYDNHDGYSYYDDYDSEEEDTLLSKRHGEAMEDKTKRNANEITSGNMDKDIADEYKAQQQEQKKKQRRMTPSTLKPEDLISTRGLSAIPYRIAAKFHASGTILGTTVTTTTNRSAKKYTKTVASMAKYSRQLVNAYRNWMDELSGGIPLEEAMWKIHSLPSKKQVKDYLQSMRNTVRNEHIERTLGLERATTLLSQLHDFEQQLHQYENEPIMSAMGQQDEDRPNEEEQELLLLQDKDNEHHPKENNGNDDDYDNFAPAASLRHEDVGPNQNNNEQASLVDSTARHDVPNSSSVRSLPAIDSTDLSRSNRVRHILEDSDDEEEATFDDVQPAAASKEARTQSSLMVQRRVLDDDDADEHEEMDAPLDGTETIQMENENVTDGNDNSQSQHENALTLDCVDNKDANKCFSSKDEAPNQSSAAIAAIAEELKENTKNSCASVVGTMNEESVEEATKDLEIDALNTQTASKTDMEGREGKSVPENPEDDTGALEIAALTQISEDDKEWSQKNVAFTQASEFSTVVATQFSQQSLILSTQHQSESSVGSPNDIERQPFRPSSYTQESETTTVIATQGTTQEWMSQNQMEGTDNDKDDDGFETQP